MQRTYDSCDSVNFENEKNIAKNSESFENFLSNLNRCNGGFFRINAEDQILDANDTCLKVFGCEDLFEFKNFYQTTLRDLIFKSLEVVRPIAVLSNNQKIYQFALKIKIEQNEIPFLFHISQQFDDVDTDNFEFNICIVNLEELQYFYEKKIEEKEKLLGIINSSIEAIMIIQDGYIKYANNTALDLSGYTLEELQSTYFLDFVFPPDRPVAREYFNNFIAGKINQPILVVRAIRKDNSVVWLEIKHSFIYWEGKPAVLGLLLSIDDKKRYEKQLVEMHSKYRYFFENANEGIIELDSENRIVFANNVFIKMLKYDSNEEILGKKFIDLFSPLEKDIVEVVLNKLKIGLNESYHLEMLCKDLTKLFVHINLIPLQDSKYDYMGALAFVLDLSIFKTNEEKMKELIVSLHLANEVAEQKAKEIEELYKELHQSQQILVETLASKDKFFDLIAHDLNNPISAFIKLTEELNENLENLTIQELREEINTLHKASENLYKLLENLLKWSRLQTGRVKFNPEPVNLTNLVKFSIDTINHIARQKNISINYNYEGDIFCDADVMMINTVINNLITNAIKFSYENSNVDIYLYENNDYVEFSISDYGVGIPAERVDSLFKLENFRSTEGTHHEKGTGLGLILCKEFIEKHNGKIWAESELGKGATFKFKIPKKIIKEN